MINFYYSASKRHVTYDFDLILAVIGIREAGDRWSRNGLRATDFTSIVNNRYSS